MNRFFGLCKFFAVDHQHDQIPVDLALTAARITRKRSAILEILTIDLKAICRRNIDYVGSSLDLASIRDGRGANGNFARQYRDFSIDAIATCNHYLGKVDPAA